MARSKPRKAAKVKATRDRGQAQVENQKRREEEEYLWKIAHDIGLESPPGVETGWKSMEDIENRFETDDSAPLILYTLPFEEFDGSIPVDQVMVSVNARGIERALRAHGINEDNAKWDTAFKLTQETLLEVAKHVVTGVTPKPCWRPATFGRDV
jgi:hypothetical protein